eukprot:GILJ01003124.1.p1 GENE.GILJ01003124.1~~GILJ01003124.1.p1  ORF type:complete len:369 (-),score=51.90 GILJ01003124.1:158-1138(-)
MIADGETDHDLAWRKALALYSSDLPKYAEAMKRLGAVHWENITEAHNSRLQWCICACRDFFFGSGLAEVLVKDERRDYFKQHGAMMPTALRQTRVEETRREVLPVGRLRVLDVGSCYGPFDPYRGELFDIDAVDLQPAVCTVHRCDFVSVPVRGPPSSGLALSPEGEVTSIATQSYDVVIFSLLLSYLPAFSHRWSCCVKARRLLRGHGLLLIVTPKSTSPSNHKVIMGWKTALEAIGFSRWRYDKLKSFHCMAYRLHPAAAQEALPDWDTQVRLMRLLVIPNDERHRNELYAAEEEEGDGGSRVVVNSEEVLQAMTELPPFDFDC